MLYLAVTLIVLGWMFNAQLSVVNIMALTGSVMTGFSWQAFLLDPLTFILWYAVAAALLFWDAVPIAAGFARSGRCRS
jgi:NosR/NirI family nitrous oxide reductase transcriptional regulator